MAEERTARKYGCMESAPLHTISSALAARPRVVDDVSDVDEQQRPGECQSGERRLFLVTHEPLFAHS